MSLRSDALRLLGRRDYTSAELEKKLLAKGADAAEVAAVLEDLRSRDLLSDRRAGAAHVRTAMRLKLRGRGRVARELMARGIDAELARELLAAMPADAEGAAIAAVLARKRLPARLSPIERRRIFHHLLRRGFSADAIQAALGARNDDESE
jgi:regulatory protein